MHCCGRRQVLGATGVVASGLILGGCGNAQDVTDAASTAGAAASDAVTRLASVADVPVGGGTVVETARVVVTQPVEGEFKAFSAVCPHQGCLVAEVRDGEIVCPCHGSRFDITTGDVVAGPATTGLNEKSVTRSDRGIIIS